MFKARCVCCIIPPHILDHLAASDDPEIREVARENLVLSESLRAERKVRSAFAFAGSAPAQGRRTVFDCETASQLATAKVRRSEDGAPAADPAVNRAFDGFGATRDFFATVLGRNSIDDEGMRLDGYVHYGDRFNNAFWNGQQMVFGNGDGRLFGDFTRSLDVIAHELTHGVTEFSAGLKYESQSGALNESVSDVFGSLVKQWINDETADQADWLLGVDIFTPVLGGDALRSLKAPGAAYDNALFGKDPQPAHMDNFQHLPNTRAGDWGGVHINSGIPNHAFYLAAVEIGGHAWDAPGQIWYEALKASSPDTRFQAFAQTTLDKARLLYGAGSREANAVRAGWLGVGIQLAA